MWGCVVAEIFWTLLVSRDSHSTIPDTGSIGSSFPSNCSPSQAICPPQLFCYSRFSWTCLHCEMTGKQHCLVPRGWPWVGHQERLLLPKGFPVSGSSLTNFQAIQGLSLVRNAFKLKCSTQIIDITTSQLKMRFHTLQKTDKHFFCIKPSVILEKNVNELLELSKVLVKEYTEDLCDQIMLPKLTLSVKLADVKTIKELVEFLNIKHAELSSTLSEVITACMPCVLDTSCYSNQRREKFLKAKVDKNIPAKHNVPGSAKFSRNAVNRESTLKWSKRQEDNRHFRRRKGPQKTFLNSDLLN